MDPKAAGELVRRFAETYWESSGLIDGGDGSPVSIFAVGWGIDKADGTEYIGVHYVLADADVTAAIVLPRMFEGFPVRYTRSPGRPRPGPLIIKAP